MKDFLENEINVGDTIIYPNRHGSKLWMNRAVVQEVREASLRVLRGDGQVKTLTRIDRVTVVTKQVS